MFTLHVQVQSFPICMFKDLESVIWLHILYIGDVTNLKYLVIMFFNLCPVTEEKWLIVFFLKAYLISWRKRCGLIFTFWRRRLRFVFLILYLTYMILRKITLSSLKFTFEIYKMVKLTYSTRSISIICDDDLWDIWKGKTVT